MATNPINPVEDEAPKRSALDTFAQAMGILTSLGGLGTQAYGIANPKPSETGMLLDFMKQNKTAEMPKFEGLNLNF